ncbi:uncharacterized protein Dvar_19330 [Desulfosarcina variabilis str. Montpellier]
MSQPGRAGQRILPGSPASIEAGHQEGDRPLLQFNGVETIQGMVSEKTPSL